MTLFSIFLSAMYSSAYCWMTHRDFWKPYFRTICTQSLPGIVFRPRLQADGVVSDSQFFKPQKAKIANRFYSFLKHDRNVRFFLVDAEELGSACAQF
jgi:hypothetical protein